MALSAENQSAYDTLKELMLQGEGDVFKRERQIAQNMGIGQSPIGFNRLSLRMQDYWKPLPQFGGQLAQREATQKFTSGEQAKSRSFTSAENEKNKKWQESLIRWQVGKQEEAADKARSQQKKDMWTQLGLSVGTGALGGGLGMMGEGTDGWGGALKGGLFGGAGVSSIAGQNIGMTQLLQLFKEMQLGG